MKKVFSLLLFWALFCFTAQAQTNYSAEIVSQATFGEGLMVTRAKIVPMSGVVSNIFFYNRVDQPWNGNNVWYEYDWEIRGKSPNTGWSQIRVRAQGESKLRDAPVDVSTSVNLGDALYNYILIRKGDTYIYDIRKDFDINTYNYNTSRAHGGNSKSLLVDGPRVYTTGNGVSDIPAWKSLDFSLGVTAFDNSWSGNLPSGDYSKEYRVDYTRFYTFNGNNLNTTPNWRDEFNSGSLDTSKWTAANWSTASTQFTPDNISFDNGKLVLTINRGNSSNNNDNNNDDNTDQNTSFASSCQKIALKGNNGKYVCSENGRDYMNCNRSWIKEWETFTVQHLGNNQVALKGSNGRYICSEDARESMTCNRSWVKEWETFTVQDLGNNQIALKGNNNKYVTATSPMTCNSSSLNNAQKFKVSYLCD